MVIKKPEWIGLLLTILFSVILIARAGLTGTVPVHWNAAGAVNLTLPAWAVASLFPLIMVLLAIAIRRQPAGRWIGGNPDRTIILGLFVLLAVQLVILQRLAGLTLDPFALGLVIVGLALLFAGNYFPKNVRRPHPIPSSHAIGWREMAIVVMIIGLSLAVAGAAILAGL
ncbi:MAG: hypothetical protein Tsb008_08030 [Rhodothalassiaceae bacterium]